MLDPCIGRHVEEDIVLTCHVDDLFVIGKKPAVEEISEEMEKKLELRYAEVGTRTNQIYF